MKIWPKFKGDLYNSGQSEVDLSAKNIVDKQKYWSFQTTGLIWSSPVVDGEDNIYFGSTDGYFYAVDNLGKLKWKYKIHDGPDSIIDSAATIGPNNTIIVPGGDGYLHCLDMKSGKKKWVFRAYHATADVEKKRDLVNSFEGNVVYNPDLDLIYAGSDNGTLYAIKPDGQEKWHFETGLMIWALPVFGLDNQWLAIGSLDGYLYFLDPVSGQLIYKKYLEGEIKSTPAYDPVANKLFVCNSLGYLYCASIIMDNKKIFWKTEWVIKFYAEVYSSPSYKDDKVVIGTMGGSLECYSYGGEKIWSYFALCAVAASPVISKDNQVIVGCKNGQLRSLDLKSGKLLWSYQASNWTYRVNLDSSPAITNGGLICVGSYDSRLYGVTPEYARLQTKKLPIELANINQSATKKHEIALVTKDIERKGHELHSLYSPIKLKIRDREKGDLSDITFSSKYQIDFFPKVDFESNLSSDRKYIYVTPKKHWRPNQQYVLKINSNTSTKQSLFKKIFSISDNLLTSNLEFRTPQIGAESELDINSEKILLHSFFIHSPTDLETYIAAAFFNQKLLINLSKLNKYKNILNAMLTPFGKNVHEQSFFLSGEHVGNHFRLFGNFDISVMGATFSISKIYLANFIDSKKRPENDVDLIFQIPLLSIRENRKNFKFPWELLKNMIDLRFQIVGSAECKMLVMPGE